MQSSGWCFRLFARRTFLEAEKLDAGQAAEGGQLIQVERASSIEPESQVAGPYQSDPQPPIAGAEAGAQDSISDGSGFR